MLSRDQKVVIIGANGTMGSGTGAVFAGRGYPTVFLARTEEKARSGVDRACSLVRSAALAESIEVAGMEDLESSLKDAALVVECVAEDPEIKSPILSRIDAALGKTLPDAPVVTMSSGLSIDGLARDRSDEFKRRFFGMHFFNPPTLLTACELIPSSYSESKLVEELEAALLTKLGRSLLHAADSPGFAGNRVGFQLLGDAVICAEERGVAAVDTLLGPWTGRAMAPLATLDLVGWDVHQAIIDNLHANTRDESSSSFILPDYFKKGMAAGLLGNKSGAGFYKKTSEGVQVLDPASLDFVAPNYQAPDFARRVASLHRRGRHQEALETQMQETGGEADFVNRAVLGYVSYALHRVGKTPGGVVGRLSDIDTVMTQGFSWAPPSAFLQLLPAETLREKMSKLEVPIPVQLENSSDLSQVVDLTPPQDVGRWFRGTV